MKTALVLGASGLIGGHVLNLLLTDNRYSNVICIGRKPLNLAHEKLIQKTGDLFAIQDFKAEFEKADDLFIAIGTTKAKTPGKVLYKKIDLGIPVEAGKLAKQAGIKNVCAVSSMGANAKSNIFYSSLKGQMEEALLALNFENLNLLRPSLLLGERDEHRIGENIGAFVMTKLDFLIPTKHKAIQGKTVAKAMVALANLPNQKTIWLNQEIKEIAAKN
jgi:uncharacterized protein YbjT (DUF2867 family)